MYEVWTYPVTTVADRRLEEDRWVKDKRLGHLPELASETTCAPTHHVSFTHDGGRCGAV